MKHRHDDTKTPSPFWERTNSSALRFTSLYSSSMTKTWLRVFNS